MTIETILVPVDFSDVTGRIVEMTRFLATTLRSKVVLLHVAQPEPDFVGFEAGPQSVRADIAKLFHHEHRKLEELRSSLESQGVEVLALQLQGPTVDKILHERERTNAGLIVLGSHGHGALYNLLAGSVTSGVLKSASCPVLVVPSAPGTA